MPLGFVHRLLKRVEQDGLGFFARSCAESVISRSGSKQDCACAVTCALKLYHHDVNPFLLRPVYQHSPACPPHVGRIYKPDTSLRIRAWAQKLKNWKTFTVIYVFQTNYKTIIYSISIINNKNHQRWRYSTAEPMKNLVHMNKSKDLNIGKI